MAAVNADRSNSVPDEYWRLQEDEEDDDSELLWHLFAAAAPALLGVGLLVIVATVAVAETVFG